MAGFRCLGCLPRSPGIVSPQLQECPQPVLKAGFSFKTGFYFRALPRACPRPVRKGLGSKSEIIQDLLSGCIPEYILEVDLLYGVQDTNHMYVDPKKKK